MEQKNNQTDPTKNTEWLIVTSSTIASIFVLLGTWVFLVVPRFFAVYADFGSALPSMTRLLFWWADNFICYVLVTLGLTVSHVIYFRSFCRLEHSSKRKIFIAEVVLLVFVILWAIFATYVPILKLGSVG